MRTLVSLKVGTSSMRTWECRRRADTMTVERVFHHALSRQWLGCSAAPGMASHRNSLSPTCKRLTHISRSEHHVHIEYRTFVYYKADMTQLYSTTYKETNSIKFNFSTRRYTAFWKWSSVHQDGIWVYGRVRVFVVWVSVHSHNAQVGGVGAGRDSSSMVGLRALIISQTTSRVFYYCITIVNILVRCDTVSKLISVSILLRYDRLLYFFWNPLV